MAKDIKEVVQGAAELAGRVVGQVAGTAAGMAAGAAKNLVGKIPSPGQARQPADGAVEELHWRDHHAGQPYYDPGYSFEDYLPAYRCGWEGRAKHPGRSFDEAERELEQDFNWNRAGSRLIWLQAREAARAAWNRVDK